MIGIILLLAGASIISTINAKNTVENENNFLNKTKIEPLFEGNSYFILLDDYTDGAGQDNHWSVQLRLDSYNDIIEYEFDTISLPLVLDQWTEIRVEIDLDGDWMEIYYDGDFLIEKEWTAGINNDYLGALTIDAVDLFANGATPVYYDDLSLEQVGTGIVWEDDFDSYADGSSMHGQGGWKGWDNDPAWTAYVTSTQAKSTPNSVSIAGNSDLVHEYSGYESGDYIYTAWVYIPSEVGDPPGITTITGTTTGTAGVSYDYMFTADDPDDDDVKYHITWGDGYTDVSEFAASGDTITVAHTYDNEGDFTITAYAEDAKGLMGPEGTLQVKMPRNKDIQISLFLRFLQNHQNMFPILRQLLGL
jgi:hypothetical protein